MEEAVIEAKPSKSLFIQTLTKDIELNDAINDLVDNSVDAAYRLRRKGTFAGLEIKISYSVRSFSIKDNCGGIDLETAKHIAFRLGRPRDAKPLEGQIGRFGIGMKRAFFKIGRTIVVESSTRDSYLKVPISIIDWSKDDDDDWDFKGETKSGLTNDEAKTGTQIKISNLYPEIVKEISSPLFTTKLIETLEKKHKQSLERGIRIFVNQTALVGRPFKLKRSENIQPGVFLETFNGRTSKPLELKVLAGIDDSNPKEAGWYLCCNGRFILEADQTIKTGWGEVGDKISIPKSHHQFARFRGFTFFECEDPSRIPWNSTKTNVDLESPYYKKARELMIAAARPVIDFLNDLDAESDSDEQPLLEAVNAATSEPVAVILDTESKNKSFVGKGIKSASDPNRSVRISYSKPLKKVKEVRDKLNVASNKEVGAETFDYYYEYELKRSS
jgi:hypothetical protein